MSHECDGGLTYGSIPREWLCYFFLRRSPCYTFFGQVSYGSERQCLFLLIAVSFVLMMFESSILRFLWDTWARFQGRVAWKRGNMGDWLRGGVTRLLPCIHRQCREERVRLSFFLRWVGTLGHFVCMLDLRSWNSCHPHTPATHCVASKSEKLLFRVVMRRSQSTLHVFWRWRSKMM